MSQSKAQKTPPEQGGTKVDKAALRHHESIIGVGRTLDLKAWWILNRVMIGVAAAGWAVAMALAIAAVDLALLHTPATQTFLDLYHGMVSPLATYPLSMEAAHGR
ncbi:hypothetical protein [Acidithiobacillus ferriphilus]|uniref:hypothetical protein n=1 Tax=Acidithiobacillus ferriphilus TaxID=1689834 RepID=UPI002DBDCF3F|nr:hypothetical protein [Acidithiobacillus ferriphilus]MEB8535520.1 hypothetical protein [Acidithiobacillus ferriphilus]